MHTRYGRRLPLSRRSSIRLAHMSWMVPAGSLLLAMLIHAANGPRAVPFFISEADAAGPQEWVFSVGLTAGGFIQAVFAWQLYHDVDSKSTTTWFVGTLVGIVASLNTVLLAYYDMWNRIDQHVLTSMTAFGGGLLWAFLAHASLGDHGTTRGNAERRVGFISSFVAFWTMVVSFRLGTSELTSQDLTTAEFLNQAQSGINVAAPAEYVLVAGLFLCLASFRHELRVPQTDERNEAMADGTV